MAEEPKQTSQDPGHEPDEELDDQAYKDLEPEPAEAADVAGGNMAGNTIGNTIGKF